MVHISKKQNKKADGKSTAEKKNQVDKRQKKRPQKMQNAQRKKTREVSKEQPKLIRAGFIQGNVRKERKSRNSVKKKCESLDNNTESDTRKQELIPATCP